MAIYPLEINTLKDGSSAHRRRYLRAVHFALTSRVYSFASEASRAAVFLLLLKSYSTGLLSLIVAQSLLMWVFFNWSSDRIQRDFGRLRASATLVCVPLMAASLCGWWINNANGAASVLPYALAVLLYAQKSRSKMLGPFGPIFRGFVVLTQFWMICLTTGVLPTSSQLMVALTLAIWTAARNLIGDLRDIRTDKNEFPVRFGVVRTKGVILGAFIVIAILAVATPVPAAKPVLWTVLGITVLVEASWSLLDDTRIYLWGYVAHKFMILVTTFIHLLIAADLGIPLYATVFLASLAVATLPSYQHVPGKRYPSRRDVIRAIWHRVPSLRAPETRP